MGFNGFELVFITFFASLLIIAMTGGKKKDEPREISSADIIRMLVARGRKSK